MKRFFPLLILIVLLSGNSFSQNTFPSTGSVGIGTTTPNASSILEVKSTTKGVLIPRMTKTQRDAIASPVQGLLIYQTNNTPGLYYYDGGWSAVAPKNANKSLGNLTAPTAVNVDLLPNANNTLNLGSSSMSWKNIYAAGSYYIGASKVLDVSGAANTFVGATGNTLNTGTYNNFIGNSAGYSNTSGSLNVACGAQALYLNTTGYDNVAIGVASLYSNTSGHDNTAVGTYSLVQNTTGTDNTAIGFAALNLNTIGSTNTATGKQSLYLNTTGFDNVATGYNALYTNSDGYANTALGARALSSNTDGYYNTATGDNALHYNTIGIWNSAYGGLALYNNTTGNYNTAYGMNALLTNTTGSENTAIGLAALYFNSTGLYNTATGKDALYSNTTGSDNTANGQGCMFANTTGSYNTAAGRNALHENTTGVENTATGHSALFYNTTGIYNTADGKDALSFNNAGSNNTANGYSALYYNSTGNSNTASGYFALYQNTTGSYNTAVGYAANVSTGDLTNATAIGYSATVDASNKVRIGSSSVSSNGGQVSWSTYSDGRIKNEVKENVPGLLFIKELRPVTFHYDVRKENELLGVKDTASWKSKYDIEKMQFTGFIAQEVESAAQKIGYDFSGVDKSGNVMGLRYSDFVVPLVKAVQELSSTDEGLKTEDVRQKSKVDSLQLTVFSLSEGLLAEQKENAEMKNQIAQLQSSISNQRSTMSDGFAQFEIDNSKFEISLLGQNIPNPFDNSTLIPFRIPKNCSDASIMITTTETSEVISVIPISCNEDHVSIDAGTLSSGTYSYTLYVNGKMVDTKEMVLTK